MTTTPTAFNLSLGALVRLQHLRTLASYQNSRTNPSFPLKTWRDMRTQTLGNWESAWATLDQGFNESTPVWYDHTGEYFRGEKFCDQVEGVRINHTGWFTDGSFQEETARGIVGRLSHGRFIAGYWLSMNSERVYFDEMFTRQADAALAADRHAQAIAELQNEYASCREGALSLEREIQNSLTRLSECLVLRRHFGMAYVRREIPGLLQRIRENRRTLEQAYWGEPLVTPGVSHHAHAENSHNRSVNHMSFNKRKKGNP